METKGIHVSQRQLQRWKVLSLVKGRKITPRERAEKTGVSYRQARRLKKKVKERGLEGLAHGNRGRPSARRVVEALREQVLRSKIGTALGTERPKFQAACAAAQVET
jgi:transposase